MAETNNDARLKVQNLVALLAFPAAYAVLDEALNWTSVYVFDWWDPKWTRRANVAIGHDLMPVMVSIAFASFLVGAALRLSWVRRARALNIAWASGAAAVMAQIVPWTFGLLTRHLQIGGAAAMAALTLIVMAPGLFVTWTFAVAQRHEEQSPSDDFLI